MEIIMSREKGQIFTAEQKSKIILELIKEEQTVAQLASKHQVTAKTITNWKKQLLDNIAVLAGLRDALDDKAYVRVGVGC
jgi:transposase-like protein